MRVITKEELSFSTKNLVMQKIESGEVFIHPTDTIYGIGCNAQISKSVKEVRKIKQRTLTPFSVIAPSRNWIFENCHISEDAREWIDKLPGPYTLILNKRNTNIADEVAPDVNTIGVRIPNHWFSSIVAEIGVPVVTTSANITNENFMTSLEDLDDRIKSQVEFILYEGEKAGRPSKIVDLTKNVRVIER